MRVGPLALAILLAWIGWTGIARAQFGPGAQIFPLLSPGYATPYRSLRDNPAGFRGPRGMERDTATEIRIGIYGPAGGSGLSLRRGAQLAVDEANSAGGFRNMPFRVAFRPSDGLWGSGAGQLVKLIYEDRVLVILGALDGAGTHVAEQVVTKAWIPLVTPTATDPGLTRTNIPWIFRCTGDDRAQAEALASFLFRDRGFRRVAGIAFTDRDGRIGMAELERLARRMGRPLNLSLKFSAGDTDFSRQLSLLEASAAEAVVIWGPPRESALFLRQLRTRVPALEVYGNGTLATPEFLEAAGSSAEGLTIPVTGDFDDRAPRTAAFRTRFRAAYGQDADLVSGYAYDGASLLISAIQGAGPDRAGIREALSAGIRFRGVTGLTGFDPTGGTTAVVRLARVTGGRWKPIP